MNCRDRVVNDVNSDAQGKCSMARSSGFGIQTLNIDLQSISKASWIPSLCYWSPDPVPPK
jgi:hypothetical protein